MLVIKEVPQKLDTVKLLLIDEKNHPRTWEAITLKSSRIMSQSLFEVTYKLDIFEIIKKNLLHVV